MEEWRRWSVEIYPELGIEYSTWVSKGLILQMVGGSIELFSNAEDHQLAIL